MSKPYKIIEICYDPTSKEYPWYCIRTGTVAEQGGLNFGVESLSFQTIEDACEYVKEATIRDMDTILDQIKIKERS